MHLQSITPARLRYPDSPAAPQEFTPPDAGSAPAPRAPNLPAAPKPTPPAPHFWADKATLAGRTIIYGGSFNPPHIGHQMTCQYLLENMGAKEVWMMPVYKHADKAHLAAFASRVGMCQLVAGNVGPGVQVTEIESVAPHTGSTYDVMSYVCRTYADKDFAFALGSDLVGSAPAWGDFDLLTQLVPIALVPRPGYPVEDEAAPELLEVSSSEVLRRVACNESVTELLPENVVDYIRDHALYTELTANKDAIR